MKWVFIILSFTTFDSIYGQDGDFSMGARGRGLAGASATLEDPWALYNNVGGLGALENSSAIASYQNRFNVKEFQSVGAAYLHHSAHVNTGVSFYRFGDDLFNQQRASIAVANSINQVSLGVGASFVQYSIEGIGSANTVILEFGGIARITPELKFAGYIHNINQAKLIENEVLPATIKAGIAYQPLDNLQIFSEIEKDLDFPEVLKLGLEYEIITHIWLRSGISTNPGKSAFGLGGKWKNFQLDYAFNDQSNLGPFNEFSLSYVFNAQ